MVFYVIVIQIASLLTGVCQSATPVFTTPSVPGRSILVPETSPAGTSVYRIVAIDADGDKLIYSMTSQIPLVPAKFTISPTTGIVSTLAEFDADVPGAILEYQIAVRVTDGINNIQTTILLIINDENDNSPQFSNYHVIRDYHKPGTVVATVLAPDSDSGVNGRVTYHIIGGNSAGAFGIDSQSGVLYTMYGLRYDQASRFELAIEARDGGAPPRTSTTTVTLSLIESYGNGAMGLVQLHLGQVVLFSWLFILVIV